MLIPTAKASSISSKTSIGKKIKNPCPITKVCLREHQLPEIILHITIITDIKAKNKTMAKGKLFNFFTNERYRQVKVRI